jgi:hypothetical protein
MTEKYKIYKNIFKNNFYGINAFIKKSSIK